jgi:hypothetical protein
MQPLCGASALARWGFAPSRGQPFAALGASRAVLEVDGFGYQASLLAVTCYLLVTTLTSHLPVTYPSLTRHLPVTYPSLPTYFLLTDYSLPGVASIQAHARLSAHRTHLSLPAVV